MAGNTRVRRFEILDLRAMLVLAMGAIAAVARAADPSPDAIRHLVDQAVAPVIKQHHIPGMEVGVIVDGKPYAFVYGFASKEPRRPVTRDTLFELGSISKTFAATLAASAQGDGALALSDPASKYLPALRGSAFDTVTVLHLGTHTHGGLPLQVPDGIEDNDALMHYFKAWKPAYAPGTHRTYSNPGIGAFGMAAAASLKGDYAALVGRRVFAALDLKSTYFDVPASRMADYAQGYAKDDAPVRMKGDVTSREAYGIRSTVPDLLRFVQANMGLIDVETKLQHAIVATHTGYFRDGGMTQDLVWEQYPYPVALRTLLDGNSPHMIYDATPVTPITPAQAPRTDVWIHKTGSTNGFGNYVAFVPDRRLGIVILANKNYPIADRVTLAHTILTALDRGR